MLKGLCFRDARGLLVAGEAWLADPPIAVYELIAITPTVAKEISIDLSVIAS